MCVYVFHNDGAFTVVFGKATVYVCTICNKQRWDNNINIRIFKREARNCCTEPEFRGLTYSNSLQYV